MGCVLPHNKMKRNKFFNWLAWKLPAGLVLWCYIRVVALSGDAPTDSYKKEYDLWVARYNLKKMGF